MQGNNKKIPVLVVEDSQEDFEVLVRACERAGFDMPLRRCKDGQEALEYLYREGAFENYPKNEQPPFILLDLNMPGMDGHTLMETIKDDDDFKYIPVIVLSTSGNSDDVFRSYQNGANSYIQKPDDLKGYVKMVEQIRAYWFECSMLPMQWGTA